LHTNPAYQAPAAADQTTPSSLAAQADKHRVYELAVQSPEADIAVIQGIYQHYHHRAPGRLREDFCGTALTLCHWAAQGESFSGEGIDNDPDPLDWGKAHNLPTLGSGSARADLRLGDVRIASVLPPDVRCAFNFSYWVFRQRQQMLEYFVSAQRDLAADGILIMDVTGGSEYLSEEPYETEIDGFSVIWQQQNFSPIDHSADLTLRFRFADGSEIEPAYHYRWRVWSIPELTELLHAAGFSQVDIWWQDEQEDETEAGVGYHLESTGLNDACWVACIAALK